MTHVLIADDEPHTRFSLSFLLESAGYLVTDAPDGRDALDKIVALRRSSHPVDLLVLDIEMPGLTGWQLLDRLEEQEIFVPTLIITGFSDNQTRMKSFDGRPMEFVLKPFTPEQLTASISHLLEAAIEEERNARDVS
jgi:CheY-like chemotaxis protein